MLCRSCGAMGNEDQRYAKRQWSMMVVIWHVIKYRHDDAQRIIVNLAYPICISSQILLRWWNAVTKSVYQVPTTTTVLPVEIVVVVVDSLVKMVNSHRVVYWVARQSDSADPPQEQAYRQSCCVETCSGQCS